METQIEIIWEVILFSVRIFALIIPGMLFANILLELGFFKKIMAPAGYFFGRFFHLPQEVTVPFVSSFGSAYSAGAMLINFRDQGLIDERQAFLSALTFYIPFHIREMFTFYIPVALPLLGMVLGSIYLSVHTISVIIVVMVIIFLGRFTLPEIAKTGELRKDEQESSPKNYWEILKRSMISSVTSLRRMALTIPLTALVFFQLISLGVFDSLPINVEVLGLPPCSTACIAAYMTNTVIGLTSLGTCFQGGDMTLIQAVKTMLWSSILASPVFLLKYSGAYYVGVYGLRLGAKLALTSFFLNEVVYIGLLVIVLQVG
ncbi:hypothetical protein [Candidatus Contubernalis alkaliaceticus]|uniref:hypothetical protein n=1 Tax=Candidatus Contubernalis alkaliaceticus TaxID=338645 RepID=UPI001F4C12FC|nr:hypothetical protein [Candidatus Contubernalis alkalaceticus]UNC93058.1 hypothetical protein HUE98_13735 [Candidatus Contubernalis alkalaceticus]